MAEIFWKLLSENEPSQMGERTREIKRVNLIPDVPGLQGENKRKKMESSLSSFPRGVPAEKDFSGGDEKAEVFGPVTKERIVADPQEFPSGDEKAEGFGPVSKERIVADPQEFPKFGTAFACGRRRDMEDAVAIHPWLCGDGKISPGFHYYGVYDGHGCSHVAMRCRDRFHELVKEELKNKLMFADAECRTAMARSFFRMDREAVSLPTNFRGSRSPPCKCELLAPDCHAVGSTAVVAVVTPEKIVVANCGDSRAVLSRNGRAFPLSIDHKPDRPDELYRIHAAGGRVIYWDGARVFGILAMSRAIGDNYLKPYVTCEPEVAIIDRTAADEFLILASDGLWDVVSNETACGVVRMCINGRARESGTSESDDNVLSSDRTCADAALLLTKLALARRTMDNVTVVVVDLRAN